MGRHKWDRTGPWQGSKDVRTCVRCGCRANKVGQRGWWDLVSRDNAATAERMNRTRQFERMPPCPWPVKEPTDE